MRQFEFLDESDTARLFHRPPAEFRRDAPADVVAPALGATLYSPATRPRLVDDLVGSRRTGVLASVICLEDAIPDDAVPAAQRNVVSTVRALAGREDETPLLFVRVRRAGQVREIVAGLGDEHQALAGFVLPKFGSAHGRAYLDAVSAASQAVGRRLWAMPVIETPLVAHVETRVPELVALAVLLAEHRERVLAVRTGATDLGAVLGLRRPRDLTVWEVRAVADALADTVNVLGRADDGFVVTGPVWEYYARTERLFKPLLRETPFTVHEERALRARILSQDLDGLIREVVLDRANGLVGKTVIHPSHVPVVHAMSVITHEEWVDAHAVLDAARKGGGASGSDYGNKMNEASPHLAWAHRVLRAADAFGVAAQDVTFVDLLAAAIRL